MTTHVTIRSILIFASLGGIGMNGGAFVNGLRKWSSSATI
jgi:hypothetical protein